MFIPNYSPEFQNVFQFFSLYVSGDAVALLIGHQTCDLLVWGLNPGWAPLCSGLWQATYTCVPLSPSSIIWYRARGWSLWLVK